MEFMDFFTIYLNDIFYDFNFITLTIAQQLNEEKKEEKKMKVFYANGKQKVIKKGDMLCIDTQENL